MFMYTLYVDMLLFWVRLLDYMLVYILIFVFIINSFDYCFYCFIVEIIYFWKHKQIITQNDLPYLEVIFC